MILILVRHTRDSEREKESSFEALKVRVQLSAYKQRVLQYYLLLALNGRYAFSLSLSLTQKHNGAFPSIRVTREPIPRVP